MPIAFGLTGSRKASVSGLLKNELTIFDTCCNPLLSPEDMVHRPARYEYQQRKQAVAAAHLRFVVDDDGNDVRGPRGMYIMMLCTTLSFL